jgi:hypothetical protein
MILALDTLAYTRHLREAGVSEKQAEAHAQALAAAMTDSLATKEDFRSLATDVRQLEVRMNARFEYFEKHFDTRLAEQEKRLETRLAEQEKRLEIRFNEQEIRMGIRFSEQGARFEGQLADLERRLTMRLGGMMVAGITVVSVLVKLL